MGRVIEADMKITIWNFSQPLSDIAKQQIIEKLGNVTVYRIEVQLDLEKSIKLQMHNICRKAQIEGNPLPDYAILPDIAAAAVWFDRWIAHYSNDVSYVKLVHLKSDGKTPPQWVLGSIE